MYINNNIFNIDNGKEFKIKNNEEDEETEKSTD